MASFFGRIFRVIVVAGLGIVATMGTTMLVSMFGAGYANDHHMIPAVNMLGMSAILVVNVIMSDLLGDDVLRGKTWDLIKAAVFFLVWLGVVYEQEVLETDRIEDIIANCGGGAVSKGMVYGGFLSPAVAAFFSYCASLCEQGTRENLALMPVKAGVISFAIGVGISIIASFVPFVMENLADILWIAPNVAVGLFMLVKRALPYQRYYED